MEALRVGREQAACTPARWCRGRGATGQSTQDPSWDMHPRESAKLLGLLFAWATNESASVEGVGRGNNYDGVDGVHR